MPLGKSYYHYFLNEDFSQPVQYASDSRFGGGLHDRVPVIQESKMFCPLEFSPQAKYLSPIGDQLWEVRALSHHGWIESVSVLSPEGTFPLKRIYRYKNKRFWSGRIDARQTGLQFVLQFEGKGRTYYLHRDYKVLPTPDFAEGFRLSPRGDSRVETRIPLGGSGYQIYPDSFCRKEIEPPPVQFNKWGAPPRLYDHFGGNLAGIQSKVGYLKELGTEFLYFNPIFQARAAHRYNCSDYRQIDSFLGTAQEFQSLVEVVHEAGMQLILDVSINHCGTDFAPFQDLLEKQQDSIYKDWFIVDSFPVEVADNHSYASWSNYKEMPLLNFDHPELRAYILDSLCYWVENFDIDGWRFDVSTEISPEFLKEITKAVRQIKPDCSLIGECWDNQNSSLAVRDGRLNGVTNFSFYWKVLLPFFVYDQMSVDRLGESLLETHWSVDWWTMAHSWNFLGNHDTPRFYSMLKKKEYYPLALAFLYALPGNPIIYYGEEIGMEGFGDPENRASMDWQAAEKGGEVQDWIQRLNAIRKKYRAVLGRGDLSIPISDPEQETFVVKRSLHSESFYFLFNFGSGAATVELTDGQFTAAPLFDVLASRPCQSGLLTLQPYSVTLLSTAK